MKKFIAFINEQNGIITVIVLYPASIRATLQNVYESGMQVPVLKKLDLTPLLNKLVVFEAQVISGADAYGVKVLEVIEVGQEFMNVMRERVHGVSISDNIPDAFTPAANSDYNVMKQVEAEMTKAAAAPPPLPAHFDELINVPGSSADYERGIDISHHNTLSDWNAIKNAGVSFVYIKISEGVGTPDNMAQTNALTARQKGFKIGYYHFARPDKRNGGTVDADATAEATEVRNLLTNLPKADLPLMLDLEDVASPPWDSPLQPAEYLQWVEKFLSFFTNPVDPNKPMIYSRKNYLDVKLPANHTLGQRYQLWLSRYTNDYKQAQPARGWNDWRTWQFTEAGKLGANSKLDLNIKKVR